MEHDIIVRAEGLIDSLKQALMQQSVWESRPLGHTTYQIRNFIFNNKEYPAGPPRYRQSVRELWARWGAYWQVKDQYDEAEFDLASAKADLACWEGKRPWLSWKRMKRQAESGRLRLHIQQIERKRAMLLVDLEHRIIPETLDILEVLKENAPSPDQVDAFSMKSEQELWEHRAKTEPRLKELMPSGNGG